MHRNRALAARLAALEAARGPVAPSPAAEAWYEAHGWLPERFCVCFALSTIGPAPVVPCDGCPRASDPRESLAWGALPVVAIEP